MKDKSPSIEEESSTLNGEYRERQNTDVAIIGISGRFAASANLEAFWSHLEGGESCIEPIKRADWETNTDADPAGVNTTQVKRGGMLEGIEQFDPLFFNISPLEAARMDPQQRFFLEEAYKAIEDAGYPAEQLSERKVGVFVGARPSDYKELCRGNRNGTCSHQKLPSTQEDQIDAHLFLGNDMGILAARISYFFNCKGPSLTIDTTSSSSLVAIHLACESIRTGESEMALVGGVFVMSSPEYYLMAEKTQMLSPDGKCKTFDKSANGIVLGEGVGALVLKRLDAAIEDRDHLYGVIKGSALNQDGRTLGMTAPSLHSQKALLSDLYKKTAIHPETVSYIEAHGTGSKLGDPIEVQALTEAFRQFTDKKQFCAIGSHKPNIGHTVSSAGVAGVLKVLLAMKYQRIPPSINIEEANPQIDFEGSPFFLNTEIREWKRGDGSLRRAGISSFGLSGTNCHLILEEPPPQKQIAHEEARPSFFFPLSAKTKESLAQKVEDMIKWLEKEGATYSVENISYTLIQGRSHFPIRSAVVARDTHDLLHALRAMMSKGISQHEETNKKGKVSEQTEPLLREYACLLIKELTDKNLKPEEYDQKLNSLAKLYIKGCNSDWGQLFKKGRYHRVPLPTYPFLRESYWIKTREGVGIGGPGGEASLAGFGVSPNPPIPQNVLGFCTSHEGSQGPTDRDKLQPLCEALSHIVSRLLNVRFEEIDAETPLSEYGFDSITFRHFANHLNQTYQLDLAPALFFEYSTLDLLAQYLHATYASALASHFPTVSSANISSNNQIISDPPVGVGGGAFRGRFFCAPPSGAGREGRSGETPETPAGAAPLDPTAKKPTSESRGGVERGGNLASTLDTNQHVSTPIAIVGMSGAFPQAPDVQSLWRNLLAGRDCIGEIPPSRWDWQSYVGNTAATEARKTNVKWAGIVEDIELFDPLFFGISRTEAEQMDPQQRILMMYVWKAIEDAGYSAERLSGTNTGLFVGTTSSGYSERVFRTNIPIEGYSSTGMTPSIGPNRMSYFLNLHGPSEAIETACSSSLVALHRGVNAIESGQCSTAIVGGVNTLICPELHISYSKAGMLSEDGRCKTFSAEANGYVRSEGVGILVLKKLSDAERAGDHIYGVIVGSAENHGGRASSLTAPNPRAQADLLIAAYRKAGIDPRTVGYIEAHGTGTPLGDPIEINGLKTAFSELISDSTNSPLWSPVGLGKLKADDGLPQGGVGGEGGEAWCGIGSVKSNIGHLELAAGVVGVIKVLLQMKYKKLVKSLHCERVNPYIQLERSPFFIVQNTMDWKALLDKAGNTLPRRAGVSSFGFGGANAYVVLEEYVSNIQGTNSSEGEQADEGRNVGETNWPALIILSAKNEERLNAQVQQLLAWVQAETCTEEGPEHAPALQDLAYTLQVGRSSMEARLALQVSSLAELEEKLHRYLQDPQEGRGDWYRGQVRRQDAISVFTTDEDGQQAIAAWMSKGKYRKLLELWVKGATIDWNRLYGERLPRRISLPTYPFARERYWIPTPTVGTVQGSSPLPTESPTVTTVSLRDRPDTFLHPCSPLGNTLEGDKSLLYIPLWDLVALPKSASAPEDPTNLVVIVGGTPDEQSTIAHVYPRAHLLEIATGASIEYIAQRLQEFGATAHGSELSPAQQAPHVFWLAPNGAQLSLTQESILAAQQQGVLAGFRLIKALLQLGYGSQRLSFTVITRQLRTLHASETGHPTHASLLGLFGSLAKEYAHWNIQQVDLPVSAPIPLVEILRLPADPQGDGWLYRNGHWYRQMLVPLDVSSSKTRETYRRGGIYVVIGGAGGIGEVVSEYLISRYKAQVIWIGRRKIDTAILAKVGRLAALGPRPYYITADASNRSALQQAYEEIKRNFGQIHGVIHSAIMLLDKSLANMDEERFQAALAAKIDVSVRLAQVFEREPLDFLLFLSSFNSFARPAGQSNYAAGCTFEDAFAAQLGRVWGSRVKVINWGYWGSVGVVASREYRERMARMGVASIEPAEAMESLEHLLAGSVGQMALLKMTGSVSPREMIQADEMVRACEPECLPSFIHNLQHTNLDIRRKPLDAETLQAMQEMEELLYKLLWSHLQSLGLFREKQAVLMHLREQAGITIGYDRWLQESVTLLERQQYLHCDGSATCAVLDSTLTESTTLWQHWDLHKERWMQNVNLKAQVVLVERMLRTLPPILTRKRSATETMFPNGSTDLVEGIYQQHLTADYFNEVLARLLVIYVQDRLTHDEHARIRILEIGAGTGGTTSKVVQMLQPYQASIAEYCYSDISKAFLHYGQWRYAVDHPYLTYRRFDVEKPLAEQGIELGCYDVVIATNVLHATSDIRHTVRNAKAALKKHGLLLLNEITGTNIFFHLTFGLLPGWWAYEDPELRVPGCPALTADNWQAVLSSEGFGPIYYPCATSSGQEPRTALTAPLEVGQQVIVAESDGLVRQPMVQSQSSENALDLLGFGVYTSPVGRPQELMSFVSPLEGIETRSESPSLRSDASAAKEPARAISIECNTDPGCESRQARGQAQCAVPTDKLHEALKQLISRLLRVQIEEIDIEASLSEYGFDSITFTTFAYHLNQTYQLDLTPALFYEQTTIKRLAQYLQATYSAVLAPHFAQAPSHVVPRKSLTSVASRVTDEVPSGVPIPTRHSRVAPSPMQVSEQKAPAATEPIAIIGMSGVFPQAPDVQSLWKNLLEGRDCIDEIPSSRWDWQTYFGNPATETNKTNIKWAGVIEDVEIFDPLFFGISKAEAEQMDPQQRLLMMYVWKAIEDAGYSAKSLSGTNTALFVGTMSSGYCERILRANTAIEGYSSTGLIPSVGPNRMSYFLNLSGPSAPIETACSSSLIAIHRGVSVLESGACSMAIVGGINTLISPEIHISLSKAGMLCEDGRCKSFGASANGFVRSEGVGMLVLKKLSEAEQAGDHIYAVIRSSAENHGGRATSLTAPNPKAQADLLIAAYRKAGVDPRTVSYIEAHGTGTELGDPIEINGLKTAFSELAQIIGEGPLPQASCGIGTLKSNIGHLELASGVAGVIKVVLQMQHKTLVKSLHCEQINPYIQLESSPFYIVQENSTWEALRDTTGNPLPRRAGVSSFGVGGANAHVVLEEYVPKPRAKLSVGSPQRPACIVLSARDKERLDEQVQHLLAWIAVNIGKRTGVVETGQASVHVPTTPFQCAIEDSAQQIEDLAYTLQVGREAMEERLAFQVNSFAELEEKLHRYLQRPQETGNWYRGQVKQHKEAVALLHADEGLRETIDRWFQYGKYEILLQWWVKGLKIEWQRLYTIGAEAGQDPIPTVPPLPRRISLPTYPFARERYWISTETSSEAEPQAISMGRSTGSLTAIPQAATSFHTLYPFNPSFQSPSRNDIGSCNLPTGGVYTPNPNKSSGNALVQQNTSTLFESQRTKLLTPGWKEEALSGESLLEEAFLPTKLLKPGASQLVLLCDLPGIEASRIQAKLPQCGRCRSLQSLQPHREQRFQDMMVQLIQELQSLRQSRPVEAVLVQVVVAHRAEPSLLEALVGVLKVVQQEYPKLQGQLIEVIGEPDEGELLVWLRENQRILPHEPHIRYQDGKRWVREWQELDHIPVGDGGSVERGGGIDRPRLVSPPSTTNYIPWKEGGCYLITGGAGGLARLFVQEIARMVQTATVILVGRSALTTQQHTQLDAARLRGSQGGIRIDYQQVDVSDGRAVHKLIQRVMQQSGYLDGIIHAAGVLHNTRFFDKTEEEVRAVLAPKVIGVELLDEASSQIPLDFFLLCSSLSAVLGGVGYVDYAGANAYLDAFAHTRAAKVLAGERQGRTLSINWPYWEAGGMQMDAEMIQMMRELVGEEPMGTETGMKSLYQALASGQTQVVVLCGQVERIKQQLRRSSDSFGSSRPTLPVESVIGPGRDSEQDAAGRDKSQPLVSTDKLSKALLQMVSNLLKIQVEQIDIETDLSEYGCDSITFTQFANRLNQTYQLNLTPAHFYEHSTIERLALYLQSTSAVVLTPHFAVASTGAPQETQKDQCQDGVLVAVPSPREYARIASGHVSEPKVPAGSEPIAIIGMSGTFPQAPDVQSLWSNLLEGRDCIGEISDSRWDWQTSFSHLTTANPNNMNIKWAGVIEGIECFDPQFFGISPREAEQMDPQQRLLMMYVWKAIEDAGYAPSSLSGSDTALFVGTASSGYGERVFRAPMAMQGYAIIGLAPTVGPNRMSYFLDLHGPSEPIDTACSSSLVAIHRGVKAIENGECSMAIVGGVNTLISPELHISASKAGMLSPDGRCKTFSAEANGYVRGEGVGMLVLKRLAEAEQDGDHIYGVILGSSENHGGRSSSLTAPNPRAQADLLIAAYRKAGIDPRTVGYIEAHGTGTPLGDPIEINGLKTAFSKLAQIIGEGPIPTAVCGIGSVKSNIGHLELAAGVVGVIKVLLQLQHKKLVKSLHCERLNPYIQLEASPFSIVQENREWEALQDQAGNTLPRRAGISSFGFGGTNAHVVLEEYVPKPLGIHEGLAASRPLWLPAPPALIVLSAKNEERLNAQVRQLLTWIQAGTGAEEPPRLQDLAYTLQVGRETMEERLALPVSSFAELSEKLHRYLQDAQGHGDWYRGQVRRQDAYGVFTADEDGQKAVTAWISKGKYGKLLELWVKGATIDWKLLYGERLPRRISLPTYPFAPERYWIPTVRSRSEEPLHHAMAGETSGNGITSRAEDRTLIPPNKVALRSLADPSVHPSRSQWAGPTGTDQPQPSISPVGSAQSFSPASSKDVGASVQMLEESHHDTIAVPQLEKELVRSLAQTLYMQESAIAMEKPFVEMGLDSVIGVEWIQSLNKRYASQLKASSVYDYPTIRQMAGFLEKELLKQQQTLVQSIPTLSQDEVSQQECLQARESVTSSEGQERSPASTILPFSTVDRKEAIAIVGMSGKYPEAPNLTAFWNNLVQGKDAVGEIPLERWNPADYYDPHPGTPGKISCQWLGALEGIEYFDPFFFHLSPAEAEGMDPQQRLFLQEGYKAFEDAGYSPLLLNNRKCGIYLGISGSEYGLLLSGHKGVDPTFMGTSPAIAAARLAYLLNLKGPAIPIDTACSSSLVATHLACQALRTQEIDMALVGGVSLYLTPDSYVSMCGAGMLSPDGRCKTFDSRANGFVPAEGVGALVLKRLADAQADHDHIYGLIIGSGTNQDGATNGITAPSVKSQIDLLREIYESYQIDPASMSYVEMHGTGTKLGDPIELEALATVFGEKREHKQYCAIGSVKSNIGHTSAAAGLAGVHKVLLQMQHKNLVPTLHFEQPNPHFDFEASPFYVNTKLRDWKRASGRPYRAAVSSFGMSGTNAHVVIEEYIVSKQATSPTGAPTPSLFVLSAKSEPQLQSYAHEMLLWIQAHVEQALSDIAYTCQVGRLAMEYRLAIVADTREVLLQRLEAFVDAHPSTGVYTGQVRRRQPSDPTSPSDDGAVLFEEDSDGQSLLHLWCQKKKLDKIAQAWVRGITIDWKLLHTGGATQTPSSVPLASALPHRVSLPTYPFARERYWVSLSVGTESTQGPPTGFGAGTGSTQSLQPPPSTDASVIHPLVQRNTSTLWEQQFRSTFHGQEFFLTDHVILGQRTLPAVAYLEMARAAVREAIGDEAQLSSSQIDISHVVWLRPLIVEEHPVTVRITLDPLENGTIAFVIRREEPEKETEEHIYCQGRILVGQAHKRERPLQDLDLPALQSRSQHQISATECYQRYREQGISYGPAFQAIEQLSAGDGVVLARLRLPVAPKLTPGVAQPHTEDGSRLSPYVLHPSLLDAALQACMGLLMEQPQSPEPHLPFALQDLTIVNEVKVSGWAWVSRRSHSATESVFDIDLCDDAGRIALRLRGLSIRPLPNEKETLTLLLVPSWKEEKIGRLSLSEETLLPTGKLAPAACDLLVLLCDLPGLQAWRIQAQLVQGGRCHSLLSLQPQRAFRFQNAVLQLIQELEHLLQSRSAGPLLVQVVVANPEEPSLLEALLGVLQTAQQEYPQLQGQLIEVEGEPEEEELLALLRENQHRAQEPYVRYQDGKRWVREWRELSLHPTPAIPWKEEGCYLITGGAGGLARLFVQEIARQVERATVILVGRSALTTQQRAQLDAAVLAGSASDIHIDYELVDVSDESAVDALVQRVLAQYGHLDGIIHAAGTLRDSLLRNKTPEQVQAVLAPKVMSVEYLDKASQQISLNFFILCSSLASVLGNVGQADYAAANAYLDAFAHARQALVLAGKRQGTTVSIDWPLWQAGGMQVQEETRQLMRKLLGAEMMGTETGMRMFYQALCSGSAQVLVVHGQVERIRQRLLGLSNRLPRTAVDEGYAGEEGNADKLRDELVHIVSRMLKVRVEEIDVETPLSEYGFDSITFTQLANRLNQTYQLDLTPAPLFEYSSLERLVQYLLANYATVLAPHFVEGSPLASESVPVAPRGKTGEISQTERAFALTGHPQGMPRHGYEHPSQADSYPCRGIPCECPAASLIPQRRSRLARQFVQMEKAPAPAATSPIAIIGMSGAFPQARDIQSFWSNLLAGKDCIGEIPPSRWDWPTSFSNTAATEIDKTNLKWAGVIEDVELFDPLFFGISPREAEQMDPQQRLLMMYVWKAIEDAGYAPSSLSGTNTALFVGTASSGYGERVSRAQAVEGYSSIGMTPSVGPNRMSYFLNLHGPSEPIETACSSSLIAIRRGVNAIAHGECSIAIVGGVNTLVSPDLHVSYSKAGMLSLDGRCKTFSAEANGYVRGEGVGMLVLKRLAEAEQDGDHIYGVIVGSSENHGGRANSLTAPNPRSQADALITAYRKAGIDPRTVGYIEAHGTGTPLGDPIEINGLKTAFSELIADSRRNAPMFSLAVSTDISLQHEQSRGRRSEKYEGRGEAWCGIGSVKSNIGHLELAAGVVGVIKVLLQMQHKKLVKSLYCERLNPYIQLEASPFYIVQENREWEALRDQAGNALPRRAGVSSFGFGGANAHVVLEEYVPKDRIPAGMRREGFYAPAYDVPQALIVLSAKNEERLNAQVQQLLVWIRTTMDSGETLGQSQQRLQNLAYTLQVGREAMEERLALQVSSFAELSEKLHRYLQDPQGDGDCYRGQVRRQDAYGAFMTDEDGQQAVATWMSKGKYRKLLELWVKGATIDWKFLYREDLPRRISLPTYPFAPERYWISTAQGRYKEPHRQAAPDEASGDGMTSRAEGRDQGPAKRVALRSLADPSVEHVGTGASPVPTRSSTLSPSQSQLEKELVRSLAQTLYIEESAIAVEKPFMEMGLDSVIGAAWIQSLNKQYASKLKASSVYNYPTIRQMAGFLEKGLLKQEQALVQSIPTLSLDDILQQLQQGTVDLGQADQLVHQVLTRAKGGDDR